ncbi:uncharacterized protein [Porites lutea]|uniref:uncharacterized protein n=1 Tax=Porites lutea TaxID=51062 RepID=UPI003CC60B09
MAHVPVIPAGADVVAAVDPPVPAPVVPPVVIPAPVAPVEAAPVVAPLAAPAPAQDPGPAPIQAVPEVADAQPIGVAALSVKIEALEKQVSADSVDRALVCVRQLAGRPVGLSDGTAIVAALESLADVSRSAGHVDFKRHEAILKQCRPLTHDPRLPAVVTQLLGDDESKKIAGQIQKILKSDHLFSAAQVHGSPFPAPARAPGYLRQQGSGRGRYTPYGYGSYNNNYASRGFNTTRCYNCRKTGHRIANCPALKRA